MIMIASLLVTFCHCNTHDQKYVEDVILTTWWSPNKSGDDDYEDYDAYGDYDGDDDDDDDELNSEGMTAKRIHEFIVLQSVAEQRMD